MNSTLADLPIAAAAENLSREDFNAAWHRAHPDAVAMDDHLAGLWPQWKAGGLGWLACRSSKEESAEIFAAVVADLLKGGAE